jgi:hypothetical protein
MRRTFLVLLVSAVVVVGFRCRHHAAAENKAALAVAIIADIAATEGQGISWRTYSDAGFATLWQHERAELRAGPDHAVLETEGWKLDLSVSKVFGIVCHVRGGDVGDYPEYGFIEFLPENGDVFDTLFSADFGGSIAALERICTKHGIPVER